METGLPAALRQSRPVTGPAAEDARKTLPKSLTGIQGLDEVTGGGFPKGRPTLICGASGCGKTLFAMEFLVRGATEFGEPGVFVAFEETAEELSQNVASLGFDLDDLVQRGSILLDHVQIERSEIQETGDYDLDGLFIRLGYAIDKIGAKRVVLDTLEVLFGSLSNAEILRAEVRRLFRWLKDKGVTAVVTAERGSGTLTRAGMEEYVSDCVILLDHRANDQISTRRLRIVKYRGSAHGTNEYPFLIDEDGISVLPTSSLGLQHEASEERVSIGVPGLDAMLGGEGVYRGSSVLVSGTAGAGKTSLAAHFAEAACRRGERCLYFAFEESERQVVRNMKSIGIDLDEEIRNGLLRFHAARPSLYGIERHLTTMRRLDREVSARCRRRRPGEQPDDGRNDGRSAFHAHAASGSSENAAGHDPADQSELRGDFRRRDRGRNLLARGYVARLAGPRGGRPTPEVLEHPEVSRDGALEPGSRVCADEPRPPAERGPTESQREGAGGAVMTSAEGGHGETDSESAREDEKRWELKLYVAGRTPKSVAALANLHRICEEHLAGKYRVEVIDLLVSPQLAQQDQIVAIPTLVLSLPAPLRKIIGDLSNTDRVLVGLQIRPVEA